MDLTSLKAWELKEKLMSKEVSSVEIVKAHLERIEKDDKDINAFISLNEDAIKDAQIVDEKISKGEEIGALAGIPIGLKDNIVTKNLRTSCGSKMLENFIPPYDAHVVERIRQEGGIIIGKTNLDEFAMGASTESSYFGPSKNPINTNLVPGGSSGGSAAAVAANLVPLTLGTDTGGSIRQPASFCGVVGIKPSYGMVSRYGVVSVANSLDQVGVFGRDIKDSLLLLNGIKGYDKRDSTSSKNSNDNINIEDVDYLKGMKVAIPKEYMDFLPKNKDIQAKFEESIEIFKNAGAIIDYVSLANLKHAIQTYMIIATSEVSSNLSRFDGIRYGHRAKDYESLDELYINSRSEAFGDEVKRRIMMGTYSLSSEHADSFYQKARKVRTLIREDFHRVFKDYDIVLSLSSPILPFEFKAFDNEPAELHKQRLYNVPANLAGLCAMSLPMGLVDGLPIGLQIIGDRFREDKMIRAGLGFEKAVL